MTYVIRYCAECRSTETLMEMTKTQYAAALIKSNGQGYHRVSARYAHNWVRDGFHHETPLYVDRGRIRRARDD